MMGKWRTGAEFASPPADRGVPVSGRCMKSQTMIVGRSHIVALLAASQNESEYKDRYVFLNTSPFEPIARAGQISNLSAHFAGRLLGLMEGSTLAVLLVNGNQHVPLSLFARTPNLEVILSDFPDLPLTPHAELVPERVFLAFFDRSQSDLRSILAFLRSVRSDLQVAIIGPPPPIESSSAIIARLDHSLRDNFLKTGVVAGPSDIAPPLFRWKAWHLLNLSFERAAREFGALWLPVPVQIFDHTRKFLAADFWGEDATHANDRYGKERLRQLEEYRDRASL